MPTGIYKRTKKHLEIMSEVTSKLWKNKKYQEKQTEAHRGHKPSKETRKRMSKAQRGTKKPGAGKYKKSEEHKKKLSESHKGKIKPWVHGDKSPLWRGGIYNNNPRKRRTFIQARRRAKKKNSNGTHAQEEWELLKAQYNYTCPACKKKEPEIKLTEDHIIPLSNSGSDYIDNIQPLCKGCNCKKYTKVIKYETLEKERNKRRKRF